MGGRCNGSEHSLYQHFSTTCGQTASRIFDSRGELEGIPFFFFLTLLVPSHYLLCLKLLKELKMLPISLALSPDPPAGPLRVLPAGC